MTHTESESDGWTVNIGDHPDRKDTPLYVRSRALMIAAVKSAQPWLFGPPPYQDHHGGGVWVVTDDGKPLLLLLPAGIEWSAQFCADPAKVERLRQSAEALVAAFPSTGDWYQHVLGMTAIDFAILYRPISTAVDVAAWTDSFWNASVPLPQSMHTGYPPKALPGYHHAPKPIVDIRVFARDDFVLFPSPGVAVVPVAPFGSGDGRVKIAWADDQVKLGEILNEQHPLALAAFAKQGALSMSTPVTDPTPAVPVPDPVFPSGFLISSTWWQWALTTIVSLAVAVGVLIGHPFSSVIIEAIVPSVALIAASIATALQVHGVHQVQIAQLQYEQSIRIAQMQMAHSERLALRGGAV